MPPDTKTSKFLSLVLRHKPDAIGLKLDASGWADIADLIAKARQSGVILTPGKIARIVATSDKRRFAISDDGSRIRANQGHSVPVDLGLPRMEPPEFLYHGTAQRSIAAIRTNGIHETPLEIKHAGQVGLKSEGRRLDYKQISGENRLANYIMEINSTHPVEIKFAALVHELAHIFCRHLNEFKNPYIKPKEKHQEEFEAEAVAYLFCYRYGFRPRSEQYLCGYLRDGQEPSVGELELILKALHRIEELLKPEDVKGIPGAFSFMLIDHNSLSEYSLTLKGKKLLYTADTPMDPPRKEKITPTVENWDTFWQTCTKTGVWSWEPVYDNPQLADEHHVEWSLTIQLGDRQVSATGKNCLPGGDGVRLDKDCPKPFAMLLKGLKALAGKRPVG